MKMIKWIKLNTARLLVRNKLKRRLIRKPGDKQNILLNVPSHGNLGDHLICIAEKKLLRDISDRKLEVFTTGDLYYGYDIIQTYIENDDVLFITGGGYLGSLWPEEELRVQRIIKDFYKNKIIILPQTIYYNKDSEESNELLQEAKLCYRSHPNLILTLREQISYSYAREILSVKNVILLPDMALYLKYNSTLERKDVLICMRNDKEKISNPDIERVIDYISQKYITKEIDTQVNRFVPQNSEDNEVNNLINEFFTSFLVITDRLHGMLYSVITSTPVIVFNNISNKIRNVYSTWLKDLPFILYIDNEEFDANTIIDFIDRIKTSQYEFDNSRYVKLLNSLKQVL